MILRLRLRRILLQMGTVASCFRFIATFLCRHDYSNPKATGCILVHVTVIPWKLTQILPSCVFLMQVQHVSQHYNSTISNSTNNIGTTVIVADIVHEALPVVR